MAFRKNKKFIDPRYFMDEKTDIIKEDRFTGGSIDIEPLSDEEQEASEEAYYELYDVLLNSALPGERPSDKLKHALRWIAKFEKSGEEHEANLKDPSYRFTHGLKENKARKN